MAAIPLLLRSCLALGGMICAAAAAAGTYEVNSIADLQSRINRAVAGDVIVVRQGVYTTSSAITIARAPRASRSGSSRRPSGPRRSPARTVST